MSLLIGLHIQRKLQGSKNVIDAVGNRIYPIAAVSSAESYPYITYQSSGTSPAYSKDGSFEDEVGVSIGIVSKNYEQAIKLAQVVRYTFEDKIAEYDEFSVRDATLATSSEEYVQDMDAYVVNLEMNFRTLDK